MGIELALDSGNADMCVQPRARGAQLRRSQPAFIIVMVMKLVSVEGGAPAEDVAGGASNHAAKIA